MVMLWFTFLPSKNVSYYTTAFANCSAGPWQFPLNEQRMFLLPRKRVFPKQKLDLWVCLWTHLKFLHLNRRTQAFYHCVLQAYQGLFKKKKWSVKIRVIIQIIFEGCCLVFFFNFLLLNIYFIGFRS